jgi:hypothetical protein
MPDWRKQGQESASNKKEGASLKLEEGTTCFRVMPDKADILPDGRYHPKDGGHPPYREYRVHRHWGPDDALVACGKDIDGKGRCWGCDVIIPQLEKDPRKADTLKKVGPQEQFVIQASKFDVNTSKFKLPKIMYLSTGAGIPGKPGTNTVALRVLTKIVGTRKDYIDPIKGFNINVERTGQGLKTKYPSIEGDETPTKVPLAVIQAVVSLDTLLPRYDEEDMKSLWFGRPRRDRNESGGTSDEGEPAGEYAEGEDAPMADEYADGAPPDDAVDADGDPVADDPGYDETDPDAVAPDDPGVDPDAPEEYSDVDDPGVDPDAPEEYSNDTEFADEPSPPPARRPAPTAGRPPARTAAPPQRAPARQPAPAARPPARPATRPAAPAARPPARPAPATAKKAAPAAAKRPAPRR